MDATTKGALIGAGATAMGGAIAWIGARSQARAALKAMTVQVRAQRLDGLWHMRRAAYAELLNSAEALRIQLGSTYGIARGWQGSTPPAGQPERLAEALDGLRKAHLDLMHKCTVLGLSVTVAESRRADSFLSVFNGVVNDLDNWIGAAGSGDIDAPVLHRGLIDRMGGLRALMDHFIDDTRGYLQTLRDVTPEEARRFERWRAWWVDWRLARAERQWEDT
ncbi:hypothetical protein [Streptomyces chryseus]